MTPAGASPRPDNLSGFPRETGNDLVLSARSGTLARVLIPLARVCTRAREHACLHTRGIA